MATRTHEQTIRQWVAEAWNGGDFSSTDSMYDPSYVLHNPDGPVEGPAALRAFISAYRSAFPDLTMTIEEMVANGEQVAWRFTVRGTHDGEFYGIRPTGKPVLVVGSVFTCFKNGRWADDHANFDALGMLVQLGVVSLEPATV